MPSNRVVVLASRFRVLNAGYADHFSGYLTEPFFQDGVIAQSANDVARLRGIPYFSSAGNQAANSWEGAFVGSGTFDAKGCERHDFGSGTTRQRLTQNRASRYTFQWEDPYFSVSGAPGASRDMDFRIYLAGTDTILAEDISNNSGGNPFAFLSLSGTGAIDFEFTLCSGTPPSLMKWIASGSVSNIQFDTQSSTSFGHKNQEYTAGVGAAFFQNTPEFGTSPPVRESFSSRGGTPILFERDGTRKTSNEVRMQPRFVATDGCINTFFGGFATFPPNGQGFYFFGTFINASVFPFQHFSLSRPWLI